jgi:hypothetical protein
MAWRDGRGILAGDGAYGRGLCCRVSSELTGIWGRVPTVGKSEKLFTRLRGFKNNAAGLNVKMGQILIENKGIYGFSSLDGMLLATMQDVAYGLVICPLERRHEMAAITLFTCVCGVQKKTSNHWVLAKTTQYGITFMPWDWNLALSNDIVTLCGEGCAASMLSRSLGEWKRPVQSVPVEVEVPELAVA